MDFVRLGPAYNTQYIPDKLIEGYNSLIWTERHGDFGEFELKSFDVDTMLSLLPEDTLVSHLETREVMQVETTSIEDVGEGVDARPEITIKGRSATNILEHRWVQAPYQIKRTMRQQYSATGAAVVLLYQAIDNTSGVDVTRAGDFWWNPWDAIPNTIVTEAVADEGAVQDWWLEQGMLYPQLQTILDTKKLGLRCLRPVLPNSPTVITIDAGITSRGYIRREVHADVDSICFEVYDGIDRSSTVQFSLLQGHLLDPKYLTSNQELKTLVEIQSGVIDIPYATPVGEIGTGWQRKTMSYDAGAPEVPDEPAAPTRPKWTTATTAQKAAYYKAYDKWLDDHAAWANARAAVVNAFVSSQTAAALALLDKQKKINMFAGDISDLSPYKYKVHYDLGDTVMLFGDYGKSAKMVVHEYVRSEDENGDRGFPGLVAS